MYFRAWLDKHPILLALGLYTYLRIIVDHGAAVFATLRQREVEFCVSLMREKVCNLLFYALLRCLSIWISLDNTTTTTTLLRTVRLTIIITKISYYVC